MLGEAWPQPEGHPGSSLTLLASTTEGALNAHGRAGQGRVSPPACPKSTSALVYTDVATAQKLLVTQRVSSLGVFLDRMESTLPAQAAPGGEAHPSWRCRPGRTRPFLPAVRNLYNRIFGALGMIIGVIVVFVVTNAMAMAIIERTREIGTLRAWAPARQLLRTLGWKAWCWAVWARWWARCWRWGWPCCCWWCR
jgi:putative ABC transport system permease protein